jgi:succinate dehydrogenase/fumarate reductase flavoprotein subunit
MGARDFERHLLSGADGSVRHEADVLVIGGGPAGAWAAVSAAAQGARVLLADKGFCGTSGATAPSGTGLWHVSPEGKAREEAKASRLAMGGHLAEHAWMDRVLEQTWDNVERLKDWGYPFPADDQGALRCTSLQGPEYMRLMRKRVKESGARILDHSPALELLVDEHGTVCGATGVNRQTGESWVARTGAVVIATGGCAFLSRALGCNVLTGDGQLMAAEVGAALSGMEFSNAYGLGPAFSSVTKSLFYNWATFYTADGVAIEGAGSSKGRGVIAQTLQSQPVFACLDRADAQIRAWMRTAQPNFFVSFDRQDIDPFTQHFPVTLRLEGTVRGTGGLHLVDDSCATSVPGLYAAGDAATRELICGGFTGGGSHNAAWALSSGFWAGAGAAAFGRDARARSQRTALRAGGRSLSVRAQLVPRRRCAARFALAARRLVGAFAHQRAGRHGHRGGARTRSGGLARHLALDVSQRSAAHRNARHAPPARAQHARSVAATPAAQRRARRGLGAEARSE